MNNTVNKPLILVRQECFDTLVKVIEEANLPAFIIEPMLKDLLSTIQHNMKVEYEQTLAWYMGQIQNQPSQEETEVDKHKIGEQTIELMEETEG